VGRIELWARAGDRPRGGVIRKTLSPNHLTGFSELVADAEVDVMEQDLSLQDIVGIRV
jgi:hypothetical protein